MEVLLTCVMLNRQEIQHIFLLNLNPTKSILKLYHIPPDIDIRIDKNMRISHDPMCKANKH